MSRLRRLLLVRHAASPATRATAFPSDEALDERGLAEATALAHVLPASTGEVLCSPAARCVQTASAAGLPVARVDGALAECDFGVWAGRTLAEVFAEDEAAGVGWMTDPDAAPHGGESLRAFAARVAAWLDRQAALDGRALAVTHGGVVKAAVVHALGAPLNAFWRVDVAPLSVTELHAHDGRWTVARVNTPTLARPAVVAA
jgi:broad specificity phosphatase PhoE